MCRIAPTAAWQPPLPHAQTLAALPRQIMGCPLTQAPASSPSYWVLPAPVARPAAPLPVGAALLAALRPPRLPAHLLKALMTMASVLAPGPPQWLNHRLEAALPRIPPQRANGAPRRQVGQWGLLPRQLRPRRQLCRRGRPPRCPRPSTLQLHMPHLARRATRHATVPWRRALAAASAPQCTVRRLEPQLTVEW